MAVAGGGESCDLRARWIPDTRSRAGLRHIRRDFNPEFVAHSSKYVRIAGENHLDSGVWAHSCSAFCSRSCPLSSLNPRNSRPFWLKIRSKWADFAPSFLRPRPPNASICRDCAGGGQSGGETRARNAPQQTHRPRRETYSRMSPRESPGRGPPRLALCSGVPAAGFRSRGRGGECARKGEKAAPHSQAALAGRSMAGGP